MSSCLVTKLRACSCGTEIRLAWKFEKAAPKTTSVIVDPAGLVDTASDGGPASGRWHGKSWWPSQWALARWASALSLCNECNECNEFADGTRYILVTLSSLVRATFTECNECNEFFSRFLLAEEKRGEGRGCRKFPAFYSLHSLHSRNRPLTRGKTVTKVVTSCNQSGRNSLHSVTRVGDFAHVSGSSP